MIFYSFSHSTHASEKPKMELQDLQIKGIFRIFLMGGRYIINVIGLTAMKKVFN